MTRFEVVGPTRTLGYVRAPDLSLAFSEARRHWPGVVFRVFYAVTQRPRPYDRLYGR